MTDWQLTLETNRSRMGYLFESGELSDCEFIIGQEKTSYKAHVLILSTASPVFYAMFHGGLSKTKVIEIPEVEPKIFAALLKYIYVDDHSLDSFNEIKGLYYLADKYIIPHLSSKCVEGIGKVIDHLNVHEVYEFAKMFDSKDLLRICKETIENCTESVINSQAFINVTKEFLIMILNSEELNISSEYVLYQAVTKWIKAEISRQNGNFEKDKDQYEELFAYIRFATMSPSEFVSGPAVDGYISNENSLAILIYLESKQINAYPEKFKITLDWGKIRYQSKTLKKYPFPRYSLREI